MTGDGVLEAALKRDRVIVLGGLVLVSLLAWGYVLAGAGMGMSALEMTGMSEPAGSAASMGPVMADQDTMAMMQPAAWSIGYATLMFFMWWIMMVAMMLPSAAPMILLFATVNRRQRARGSPFVPTGIFALGYLVTWALFSVVAVALQGGFERAGLLSPMLVGTSTILAGLLLLAAGLYQLTPLKHACLKHCRGPLQVLSTHWRQGARGAFRMGLEHGAFCVGCCWFLMGLLFVGGVMNLYWIGGLALFILLEKTIPAGHWLGTVTGVLLAAAGGWMLVA